MRPYQHFFLNVNISVVYKQKWVVHGLRKSARLTIKAVLFVLLSGILMSIQVYLLLSDDFRPSVIIKMGVLVEALHW